MYLRFLLQRLRVTASLVFLAMLGAVSHTHAQDALPSIKIAMIEGMSGAFANAGEAVLRNLRFAVERINADGGVHTAQGKRVLELLVLDGKGQAEESLVMLKAAIDRGVVAILQGNSSAVAGVLSEAIEKHNERETKKRMVFLNYSAVDPVLTNEKCTYWHFRFDAHTDMRMAALVSAIAQNTAIKKVYLINQDYVFGQGVARSARAMLSSLRPDIQFVGDDLHPLGRIKDFAPYVTKMKASGTQAVITGNWGNDLTLMVKAAKDVGLDVNFYTFYGNGLGAPAAIGDAGVDRVVAVSEWHNNASTGAALTAIDALYTAFRKRYPDPKEDYFNPRNVLAIDMYVKAIEQAGTADATAVAKQLEGMHYKTQGFDATMRTADHQLIQPLVVYQMAKQGTQGVNKDLEGSGYGFRTMLTIPAAGLTQKHQCDMKRPL